MYIKLYIYIYKIIIFLKKSYTNLHNERQYNIEQQPYRHTVIISRGLKLSHDYVSNHTPLQVARPIQVLVHVQLRHLTKIHMPT